MFGWANLGRIVLAAAALVLFGRTSMAQETDKLARDMAQTLMTEAGALMDAGRFADACPKFDQATQLVPSGIGARMALAKCYAGLGKLMRAFQQYVQAEKLALGKKDKRAAEARAELDKLGPQLAIVTIVVPDWMRELPGLSLTWDGTWQDPALWGAPLPVDAGAHVLQVKAPGLQTWTRAVVIEKDGISFEEKVPDLRRLSPPPREPEQLREQPPALQTEAPPVPVKSPEVVPKSQPVKVIAAIPAIRQASVPKWIQPAGVLGLGIGFVGITAGSVLGGIAKSRLDASNAIGQCDARNWCNGYGVSMRAESLAYANAATGAFAGGGVFVGIGSVLLLTRALNGKEPSPRAASSWNAEIAPGWIGMRGVW